MSFEVIWNALNYISEEMGVTLKNTAYSPNIRDRQDHTCAILSPEGYLVAQAEHIPVHIGSMAIGLKNTLRYLEDEGIEVGGGDIVIVNNPYISGTHLNDVTLIKPVYHGNRLIAYISNKAHHTDVGGKVPGSIGGEIKDLYDEGIVIDPQYLVKDGELNKELIKKLMDKVRTPVYLKGDLMAQVAAINVGEKRIKELLNRFGVEKLLEAYEESLRYVERYVKNRLEVRVRRGVYKAEDYLEGYYEEDLMIKVSLKVDDERVFIDYTGTSWEVDAPLNAVFGVTVAATTYTFKTILDPYLPFNHGIYNVLDVYAPYKTILNPSYPHPVSAGNLETSQRIVDTIYRALSRASDIVPAASCGSMNNIMLGAKDWAFYETVGGGCGARPYKDGVDGVHTNMTNTLNTPIEIIEKEYPIQFIRYSLRNDSCGYGRYRGGLGLTRAFKLLSSATLTVVASRIRYKPYGLEGGEPGEPGDHYIIREGRKIPIGPYTTINLEEGDIVYINTPGGGGYGDPMERRYEDIIQDLSLGKVSKAYLSKIGIDIENH